MLNFKKIEKEDIETLRKALGGDTSVCDHTVGGIFLWRGWFDTHYCVYGDTLFLRVRYTEDHTAFTFVGGDPREAYSTLKRYCFQSGEELRLYCITIDVMETLKTEFPELRFTAERDMFDYIYDAKEFSSLVGKKWNGQRNHVNRFKKTYPNYSVNIIETNSDIERIRDFFRLLKTTRLKGFSAAFEELERIDEALTLFTELGLCGAYITVDGIVVAAALGEIVGNVLFEHVEKALVEYTGIYPMMAGSFASLFGKNVRYINREEDEGDEGLRRSKMSYHPVILKEKYIAK